MCPKHIQVFVHQTFTALHFLVASSNWLRLSERRRPPPSSPPTPWPRPSWQERPGPGTKARGRRRPPPGRILPGGSDILSAPSWGCRGWRCLSGCSRWGRRRRDPPASPGGATWGERGGGGAWGTCSCPRGADGPWNPPARPRPCPGGSPLRDDLRDKTLLW